MGRRLLHDPGRYRHARVADIDAGTDEQDPRASYELGDLAFMAVAEGAEQQPGHTYNLL